MKNKITFTEIKICNKFQHILFRLLEKIKLIKSKTVFVEGVLFVTYYWSDDCYMVKVNNKLI